jgi:hypothetical protein
VRAGRAVPGRGRRRGTPAPRGHARRLGAARPSRLLTFRQADLCSLQRHDLFSRIGHLAGFALIAAGLVVIAIGWYGASGSGAQVNGQTTVTAQLPYLLSGGALGVALVVTGAAVLVVHAVRSSRDRVEDALVALAQVVVDRAGTGAVPKDGSTLVAAGSASYHAVTCRLVPSRDDAEVLTPQEAMDRGLRPCRMCRPPLPDDAVTATLG